jgi:hypothetical protein
VRRRAACWRIELLVARIRRHLPWTENVGLRCHHLRHISGRMMFKAADQHSDVD